MPSETIYGQDNRVDVRVSWGTNEVGQVQVVTLAAGEDATERLVDVMNDWLEAAGMPVIDLAELKRKLSYTPFFDGWHASLTNWAEVNRLIRTLRRARDRQFGEPA